VNLPSLVPGTLSAASALITTLHAAVHGPLLLLGLAALVLPTTLRVVLSYRLQVRAVDKAAADDLPALFHAFNSTPDSDPTDQDPPP